jgi:hypothetical protein
MVKNSPIFGQLGDFQILLKKWQPQLSSGVQIFCLHLDNYLAKQCSIFVDIDFCHCWIGAFTEFKINLVFFLFIFRVVELPYVPHRRDTVSA